MKNIKVKINNEEKDLEVLYTFESENTKKEYVICTDNLLEDNNLNIYSFIINSKERIIEKITDENDYMEVEKFLKLYSEEM